MWIKLISRWNTNNDGGPKIVMDENSIPYLLFYYYFIREWQWNVKRSPMHNILWIYVILCVSIMYFMPLWMDGCAPVSFQIFRPTLCFFGLMLGWLLLTFLSLVDEFKDHEICWIRAIVMWRCYMMAAGSMLTHRHPLRSIRSSPI